MQIDAARFKIEHFRHLIAAETDPKTLDLLHRLLAEEEAKPAQRLAPGARRHEAAGMATPPEFERFSLKVAQTGAFPAPKSRRCGQFQFLRSYR